MRITLGPTGQIEPITEGLGQIWVGQTSGGIEIVAVIAVVGCNPEDHEAFARESATGGTSLQFAQAATAKPPHTVHNLPGHADRGMTAHSARRPVQGFRRLSR